ncbi:MAG: polymerase sigma factor FliA [Thermoleophilaceae bacterium]|nr:polymerase sigma factor FliA [Thermoleophilaceae bacterium]
MRLTTWTTERPMPAATLALWETYRESGDPRSRDRLVMTFAPLVKYLAYRKLRALPAHVSVEELISSGLEALLGALDRYDPAKGASLEQFLTARIRGAMLDELRRQDWAPRSLRTTERDVRHARRDLRAVHRRRPSDAEVGRAVGITPARLHTHQQDVLAMSAVGSLNAPVSDGELGSAERGDLLVALDGDPEAAAFGKADGEALATALATLTARERTVMGLLYIHEMTLVEVGQVLGVSESRVCQISGRVKARLHRELAGGALALAV